MNWTQEMVDAVTGNERPHGLAKRYRVCGEYSVASLIEEAHKEGAPIQWWNADRGWVVDLPMWVGGTAYRVAPSWTPAPPKPPEKKYGVVRCPVDVSGFGDIGYQDGADWRYIDRAVRRRDFKGYKYADGMVTGSPRVSEQSDGPAPIPVAVLFWREVKA